MEPNENEISVPNRQGSCRGVLDHPSTREIKSANARLYNMPRPPPTGEDSSENDRLKEGLVGQFKPDSYEPPSPRLTPRRSTAKELPGNRGASLAIDEEEKLAPLGFEPEGQAVCSPTFYERLGSCFTDMLSNYEGSYVFYQYLRRINRDILLDFCRTCDDFRGMVPTSPQTRSTAKAIFQKYVFPRETCELLGIKESSRTKIAEHISDQPTDPLLFEQACSEVMMNLKTTYYESFLSSSFYKEFAETHCESPKIINEMVVPYNGRFQGGYLPTLPEEKVLGFGEEIEEFEYEQCRNSKGLSGLPYSTNPTSDEKNARKLLHNPVKDINSSYYYPTAPLASITESAESQSMSSDALTDDTLSMTTDTSDGHSRHSGGRRQSHRSRNAASNSVSRFPFVPRTHRMPKEARNPLNPEEFVRILNQKLEKVVIERQLQEREAINLSHSIDVESSSSGHSKKSILQEAIENKERRDRIPLSTMAMMSPLPVQDDTASISTSNQSSSKSTSANATAGSGAVNSSSSDSTHKRSRSRHASKSSKHESDKSSDQAPHLHRESSKLHKDNIPADHNIPFLTVNHHRIMKWMETGEEELQKHKTTKVRHQSKSRQSSSSSRTGETYSGQFQPNQPIAQDPMMPLLPQPEATTVLGEVRRRLMETKEQDRRSKHNQKHRSRGSVDNASDSMSSFQDKTSSTDCSSCAQSLLSYDLKPHQSCEASSTFSSIPSSASNINNDTKSRSDSGIGTGIRKKEKHNSTTIIYWLWGEPIAYRTSLPGKNVTLGQFKTLIMRKGEFRFFFKTKTDEEDRDCEVVYEEVRDDESKLPLYEGKIVGKVEKVDS